MMKTLACKDIDPSSDCHFVATGSSSKEVVDKLMAHMKAEHPDEVKGMDMSDDEMKKMMESKVH